MGAADDVKALDPARTVLARGLPIDANANAVRALFASCSAGEVASVTLGVESSSRGRGGGATTYRVAAVEFSSPPAASALALLKGMEVPGGHPAGVAHLPFDPRKHARLFKEGAGAGDAPIAEQDDEAEDADGDATEKAAGGKAGDGWGPARSPSPEPEEPVSVRLAREKEAEEKKRAEAEAEREREEKARAAAAAAADDDDDDDLLGSALGSPVGSDMMRSRSPTPAAPVVQIEYAAVTLTKDDYDDDAEEEEEEADDAPRRGKRAHASPPSREERGPGRERSPPRHRSPPRQRPRNDSAQGATGFGGPPGGGGGAGPRGAGPGPGPGPGYQGQGYHQGPQGPGGRSYSPPRDGSAWRGGPGPRGRSPPRDYRGGNGGHPPPRESWDRRDDVGSAPATLRDGCQIFLSRGRVHALCAAGPEGPGFGAGLDADVRFAMDALRDCRGAIVRVGVGGGQYQVAELAGGAPAGPNDPANSATQPVLRLIDGQTARVAERPHSLGVISNSEPSQREWDEYVDACEACARARTGPPPPRVKDVATVRRAIERAFREHDDRELGGGGGFRDDVRQPPGGRGGGGPPPAAFGRSGWDDRGDRGGGGGPPPPRDRRCVLSHTGPHTTASAW